MRNAGFDVSVSNAIYAVQIRPPDGPVKVGRARDPWKRWEMMMQAWPFEYEIELWALVPNAYAEEEDLHMRLRSHRIRGEWYHPHANARAALEELARSYR